MWRSEKVLGQTSLNKKCQNKHCRCRATALADHKQPASRSLAKLRGLLRTSRRVPSRVAVGARACELAALRDEVVVRNRLIVEEALQDLARACGIASLRRQAGAGD